MQLCFNSVFDLHQLLRENLKYLEVHTKWLYSFIRCILTEMNYSKILKDVLSCQLAGSSCLTLHHKWGKKYNKCCFSQLNFFLSQMPAAYFPFTFIKTYRAWIFSLFGISPSLDSGQGGDRSQLPRLSWFMDSCSHWPFCSADNIRIPDAQQAIVLQVKYAIAVLNVSLHLIITVHLQNTHFSL